MNIIERGRAFLQSLHQMVEEARKKWQRCPECGSTVTVKWGSYERYPWFLAGRKKVRVQRYRCQACQRTFSESSPWLIERSWYGREVQRCGIDVWQHGGTSLRRTAELLRSLMGKQERYRLWDPLVESEGGCHLSASTLHRWLDRAGRAAELSVVGQLAGIEQSGQMGADGLWARLRRGSHRVVLLVTDSVSGLIWPLVLARGEKSEGPWGRLFGRAREAGLDLDGIRGVTSDGVTGLASYLKRRLGWVNQQRCVWHIWRNLGGEIGRAAARSAAGLAGPEAEAAKATARQELVQQIHKVLDAENYEAAEKALVQLREDPSGHRVGELLNQQLDRVMMHQMAYHEGLKRVSPEWCWRDFRLRLSRGRNHGSEERLERATLLWAIYRNFEPAQSRYERKRVYRHPGQSPLQVARAAPGSVSYLDALGV